jgi:hypothetical protein
MGWLEDVSKSLEEDEGKWLGDVVSSLNASEAATPAYLSSQAEAIEAAGDIFGVSTPSVSGFKQEQQEKLQGFESKYPEGLFKTEDPAGWWKEKATLNSMNQIVPYLGYTAGAILQAMPHPVAKGLGVLINSGTFASQYSANFADTLQEHEERAGRPLTDSEKAWAGIVSGGVVALDRLVPGKMAKDVVKKMGGPKAVETARKSLIKRMNAARDNLGTSLKKGAGYVGGKMSQEALTEAAQKALQITTSQDPGYLATTEGLESVVEEAAVAGPTSGVLSTPGAVLEGTSVNRDIARARRQAGSFNVRQKKAAEDIFRDTGIDTQADLITVPEAQGVFAEGNKLLDKYGVKKGIQTLGDVGVFKPLSSIKRARDRQVSGKSSALLNDILQSFVPTGTASGETQIQQDFYGIKETTHGELLASVTDILNKHSDKTPGLGHLGQRLNPEINKYIKDVLTGKTPQDPARVELNNDIAIIRGKLDLANTRMKGAGISVGYQKNYLHRPVSQDAVKKDREGFVKDLIESSRKTGKESLYISEKEANTIADDIIEGKDPDIVTSKYIKDRKKLRKGVSKQSFEKSRSTAWDNLSERYREQDLGNILEGYLSKAATRIASAETFGAKGEKIKGKLDELVKDKAVTQDEVDRVWDVYDAAHNVYRRDVSEGERGWRKASKVLTTVSAVTHLGLATFSSLTELVWIGERAGFGNMLRTLPAALDYTIKGIKKGASGKYVKPGEGSQALATLGYNLNPALNDRLDQMFSTDRSAVLNMYFRSPMGSFLTQWTNFNRNWAAQTGLQMMNRRASHLDRLSGIDKRRLQSELKENGLNMDEFKQLAELSKKDGNVNINIIDDAYLNTEFTRSNGTKTRVRDVLVPWIHKLVDDVVVHPKATNKPLWMSDPSLSAIAQLKTFPIVFGNTVVKRLMRKLNPNNCSTDFGLAMSVVGSIAAAMAVAHLAEQIKSEIRGRDPRDMTAWDLGNMSGLTGAPGALLGGSKYGDLTTSLLGPSVDAVFNKTFSEVINPFLVDGEPASAGANLVDWVGESIDSALGPVGMHFKPFEEDK